MSIDFVTLNLKFLQGRDTEDNVRGVFQFNFCANIRLLDLYF